MARTIVFDETMDGMQQRVGTLQDSLQGLDAALRTAETGARRAAATTQGLRAAFVHAAAPLTDTLNPALTELNSLTGALGGRSGAVKAAAGLDQVEQAASSAAKSTAKAVRTLAGFDEIIRLGAASSSSKKSGSGSSGSKKDSGKETEQAVSSARGVLDTLKGALDAFWAYLRSYYAPAILSWSAAWNRMREAALAAWGPVSEAARELWQGTLVPLGNYLLTEFLPGLVNSFSLALWPVVGGLGAAAVTALGNAFVWLADVAGQAVDGVIRPALESVQTVWYAMMQAVHNAWQTYGQPIYAGIIAAADNLCGVLNNLWTGTLLPILQGVLQQVSALWQECLVPLFADFTMYLGSAVTLLLNLWNEVLALLLQWLTAAFGPVVTQVCLAISGAVTTAVGVIAGLMSTLLTAMQGMADFLSDVLCGRWEDAWNGMADTAARVWERITGTIQTAISGLQELVGGFVSGIVEAAQTALNALGQLGGTAGSGKVPSSYYGQSRTFSVMPSLPQGALQVPALARGAVIPPNREFLAVLGDQKHGTNVEAPLATIQQAVAETMQDMAEGEQAALNQVSALLREILGAVYGIRVGDEVIGRAAQRYQTRQSVITGGY